MKKTYYCVHERNTRYHEIKAESLVEATIVANIKFGNMYLPASRKNALAQSSYHLFDDDWMMKKLFPKAKWSGISEANDGVWNYVTWEGK